MSTRAATGVNVGDPTRPRAFEGVFGSWPDWMLTAPCSSTDPGAFYPEAGGSTKPAKAICNGSPGRPACPVREKCLQFALDHDERFGVFGGLSPVERRKLGGEFECRHDGCTTRLNTTRGRASHEARCPTTDTKEDAP